MDTSGLIKMLLQCSYLIFTLNCVHARNKQKVCLIKLGLSQVCNELEFWQYGTSWKVLNLVKFKACLKCRCLEKK